MIAVLLLLSTGCLPQDDLGSYSRAWENRPASATPESTGVPGPSPLDASIGSGGATGSNGGAAAGGAGQDAGDAGPRGLDAGGEPSADASTGAELDAGAADAAP